jgi:hypothetical protein
VVVIVAAMVLYVVVTSRSPSDQSTSDPAVATSGSSKIQQACEDAQLKLLKGEVTNTSERFNLTEDVNRYCKDKTTP